MYIFSIGINSLEQFLINFIGSTFFLIQNKFASRSRVWSSNTTCTNQDFLSINAATDAMVRTEPRVKLRLDHYPKGFVDCGNALTVQRCTDAMRLE